MCNCNPQSLGLEASNKGRLYTYSVISYTTKFKVIYDHDILWHRLYHPYMIHHDPLIWSIHRSCTNKNCYFGMAFFVSLVSSPSSLASSASASGSWQTKPQVWLWLGWSRMISMDWVMATPHFKKPPVRLLDISGSSGTQETSWGHFAPKAFFDVPRLRNWDSLRLKLGWLASQTIRLWFSSSQGWYVYFWWVHDYNFHLTNKSLITALIEHLQETMVFLRTHL